MENQTNQPKAGESEAEKKKALGSIEKIYGKNAEEQKKEQYMRGLFRGGVPGMAERRKKLTQERGPQTDV